LNTVDNRCTKLTSFQLESQQLSHYENLQLIRPAKYNHNFQFSAGIGIRLGDLSSGENDVKTPASKRTRAPRYELGAQSTLLNLFPLPNVRPCPDCLSSGAVQTHPGFGGRFSFNLTDDVALEAEGNFFTRDIKDLPNPSGHMFQGQFGAKIGKRFEKWGAFGKSDRDLSGLLKSANCSANALSKASSEFRYW